MESTPAFLLIQNDNGNLERLVIGRGQTITIVLLSKGVKHCVGWYDISTHEDHTCETGRIVDQKFEACFECRKRTGFNPAFYNTEAISSVQAAYNRQSHSVYIAYFGNGLAKAGILSDSRGLERIYEQGALLYSNLGSHANAMQACSLEASLIEKGLRNSTTKKQKEDVLRSQFNCDQEAAHFSSLLRDIGLDREKHSEIVSNVDHFFFGSYQGDQITPVNNVVVSGSIVGVVGRYLVVSNRGRLLGLWLTELAGYAIEINDTLRDMDAEPLQSSLF